MKKMWLPVFFIMGVVFLNGCSSKNSSLNVSSVSDNNEDLRLKYEKKMEEEYFSSPLRSQSFSTKNCEITNKRTLKELESVLVGFWNFGFPLSSSIYGYFFDGDYVFAYYNGKDSGYIGTIGKWGLYKQSYHVFVIPTHHCFKNGKNIECKEEKKLKGDLSKKDFQLITDLRSLNYYWFPTETEVEGIYPPSLSMKFFQEQEITSSVNSYFFVPKAEINGDLKFMIENAKLSEG